MHIAVISDIHANMLALNKVAENAGQCLVDHYWLLGDTVGYGPDPVGVLLWMKTNSRMINNDWVLGNHDAYMAGYLSGEEMAGFEKNARAVIDIQRLELAKSKEAKKFFSKQFSKQKIGPCKRHIEGIDYWLVHASQVNPLGRYIYPWDPGIYLEHEISEIKARSNGGSLVVQWFGHTHIPTFISCRWNSTTQKWIFNSKKIVPGEKYPINESEGEIFLINPGSVGFPRDNDVRASYAILDTTERWVMFHRVEYADQEIARNLQKKKFPENIIRRLNQALPPENMPREWESFYKKTSLRKEENDHV